MGHPIPSQENLDVMTTGTGSGGQCGHGVGSLAPRSGGEQEEKSQS